MIPLTADDTRLLKDVAHFSEPVQVCDPSGKVLGIFVPASRERSKSHFDPEELKRRMAEKSAGLFSDVVERLKVMTEESNRRRAAGEKDFTLEEARAFLAGKACQPPAGPEES
jgi:hypothetical protein